MQLKRLQIALPKRELLLPDHKITREIVLPCFFILYMPPLSLLSLKTLYSPMIWSLKVFKTSFTTFISRMLIWRTKSLRPNSCCSKLCRWAIQPLFDMSVNRRRADGALAERLQMLITPPTVITWHTACIHPIKGLVSHGHPRLKTNTPSVATEGPHPDSAPWP